MNHLKYILLLGSLSISQINGMAQKVTYPTTAKDATVDVYYGQKVEDPYRWLENDTSAATNAWVKAQNEVTFDYLNKLPLKNWFKERLTQVWNYEKQGIPSVNGPYITYYKNDGLQNQSILYIKDTRTGKEEVLIDPNKLSKDGTVALGGVAFSKNHKYIAYTVSASGSDWQEIYVMDVATKKVLSDKIEHVKFTSLQWIGDQGFYYSGYDKPKDLNTKYSAKTEYHKVFFHKLGSPAQQDLLVYEDKLHPLRYVSAQVTENEQYLILNISEGTDGSEVKIKDLKQKKSEFITLVEGFNTNAYVLETLGDKIVIYSNAGADNYKLFTTTIKNNSFTPWETLVQEYNSKLEGATIFGNKIYCSYLEKASTKIVAYDDKGNLLPPPISEDGHLTISGFGGKKDAQYTYYATTGYTEPTKIYKYDLKTGTSSLHFAPKVDFNQDDFETTQLTYVSKDGTEVTMFMVAKKNIQKDGSNPTMLYGYGGFNISLTPSFSPAIIPFLEKGGIYCVVNLRGGGEYGEQWHKGGMLDKKQNVFDDFIGAAEYLIEEGYTSSNKLAIRGGSNGGLLVGACMTQRPELFAVAFPQVGVLDMLRFHKFTVGWGWVVEYGSSDAKDQFEYLYKYSPLHQVKKGTCYPATMVTTADHDDRVVPAHSFKFAAALQEAQSCNNPTLIRIDVNAGHGAGKPTSKTIEENADIWAFMMNNIK